MKTICWHVHCRFKKKIECDAAGKLAKRREALQSCDLKNNGANRAESTAIGISDLEVYGNAIQRKRKHCENRRIASTAPAGNEPNRVGTLQTPSIMQLCLFNPISGGRLYKPPSGFLRIG